MKKRVLLLVGNELCIAGVPNVIMKIVEELHESYTFDAFVFSTRKGEWDERFLSYGGKIFSIDLPRYPQYPIKCFWAYRKLYAKLKSIFQENHYHAIHGHSGYFDGVCLMAARRCGIPVRISHAHGTYAWVGRNFLVKYYLELGKRMIAKNATQRVACADIAGETLFMARPYFNVLNPVDVSYYDGIEKIAHTSINLLQIGYFDPVKNQLFSIDLLKYLREKGVDAKLYLIGYPSNPGYLERMERAIAKGELEEFVSFLPSDFDKRIAFAQTDYCILPSDSEGLPLVALESQAAGVPCLMSDRISRNADVGAGIYITHNDLEKWADAIVNGVCVDPDRLTRNLRMISTQAYANKIRNIYEQNT